MKRVLLAFILLLAILNATHALSWAYGFVVWDGNVYEVKQEMVVPDSDVGKLIGKVKTQPNDMTGSYYGDASNYYPIGTNYAEIKGTPTAEAIAVEANSYWMQAVYVYEAPFHVMNVLTNPLFLLAFGGIGLLIGAAVYKRKRSIFNH